MRRLRSLLHRVRDPRKKCARCRLEAQLYAKLVVFCERIYDEAVAARVHDAVLRELLRQGV